MNIKTSAFWEFSLRFYARPGVAPACLDIQNKAGADVNVVLFLLYLASNGRQVGLDEVTRIDDMVAAWREQVVRPLRTARRHLKSVAAPFTGEETAYLRNEIKRDELAAEKIQQYAIEAMFPPLRCGAVSADSATAARENLGAYAARNGALPADAVQILLNNFNQL